MITGRAFVAILATWVFLAVAVRADEAPRPGNVADRTAQKKEAEKWRAEKLGSCGVRGVVL